jgi:hypothetical protein
MTLMMARKDVRASHNKLAQDNFGRPSFGESITGKGAVERKRRKADGERVWRSDYFFIIIMEEFLVGLVEEVR